MNSFSRTALTCLFSAMLVITACRKPAAVAPPQPARTESVKHGPLTAEVSVNPGTVSLDGHLIFTLTVTHPADVTVEIPDLSDRAEGFVAGQSFDRPSIDSDGNAVLERVVRLTPKASVEHRIAPIPIVYYTRTASNGRNQWFPTPALRLEESPLPPESAGVNDQVSPVWIRPSAKEMSILALASLLLIGLIALAMRFIRKGITYVRLLRMSPRDRAMEELRMLLAKDLVVRHLVKDFYLELTLIVRMFIERGYRLRAPELTTEEFLASAGNDPRFSPKVISKLKAFLQSADLVKFAGFVPDQASTDQAVTSAREFISVESSDNPDTYRKQEVTDA